MEYSPQLINLTYLVLIALLACVPTRELLEPSLFTRIAAGLLSGGFSVLIVLMQPLHSMAPALFVSPALIAVSTFYLGGLTGGMAALVAIALHHNGSAADSLTAAMQAALMWSLGWLGFWLRARRHVTAWTAIPTLALAMPLLRMPWMPSMGLVQNMALPNVPWLLSGLWDDLFGTLLLAGGMELLRSRACAMQEQRLRCEELPARMETDGGGCWEWDLRTDQLSSHGALYQAFGLKKGMNGEHVWQHWRARNHPEDLVRAAPYLEQFLRGTADTYCTESRVRNQEGQWRWLLSCGQVIERDTSGRPVRMQGMDMDITAHRELRDALHASETQYAVFYQTLPDPAGITRISDGRYLDVNPAFSRMLGYERHEVLGKTAVELGIWRSDEERHQLTEGLRLAGEVIQLKMTAYRGDTAISGLMSARVVRMADDDCLIFIFHDMRAEQKIRDDLLDSHRLLQQAGWMARLGVWKHTARDGLVYWSDVCYDIHGLSQSSPLPQQYLERYVAPEHRAAIAEQFRKSLSHPCSWEIEAEILRTDGRRVWVRVLGESIVEKGQIICVRGVMQDIDDWKRSEQRLRNSEEKFTRVFELLPLPTAMTRLSDGQFMDVNPAWEKTMGYTRAEALLGTGFSLGILTQSDRQEAIDAAGSLNRLLNHEINVTTRSGEKRTMLESMCLIDIRGEACWLFTLQDITDRQRAEQKVREREELLSLTIAAADLGLWDWNMQTGEIVGDPRWRKTLELPSEGTIHTDSPAWIRSLTPQHADAVATEMLRHIANPAAPFDAIWQIRPAAGPSRWVRSLGKIVSFDANRQPLRMVGVTSNVTNLHAQQEQLQKMAHYDALTGLPNRVLLGRRLQDYMEDARNQSRQLALAYLDLDGFKPVNDQLGHDAGDRLLTIVADRLVQSLRPMDCVARLGGDEFVILLPGLESREECEHLLNTIMRSIAAPYVLERDRAVVTASIGYTLYPDDGADADTLLRHADQAMYVAKQAGRNRFHAFDAAQERALQTQREIGAQIAGALAQGQFVLHLQPKVNMHHGSVVGAEALARWQHPERGLLSPGAFLPLIENTDLEVPFGEWVVETALDEIERLHAQGLMLPISINISARHLQQQGFARWMAQRLAARTGVPARMLDLEITESAALYDIQHVAGELASLRDLGIAISLDDFGTGYSSLTYLRRLPMDHLKLDQSFVKGMTADSSDLAIVQGVIGLARSFGYSLVAEGVETIEQGKMLLQMGCTLAQGYCVARPMPAHEFPAWVAHWKAPVEWQRGRSL